MHSSHLHIIALNVPYPVDYGGVVDLFYKLPALYESGVQIHLHCFDYGRGRQLMLEKYCTSVEYYERNTQAPGVFNTLPYIVSSRKNETLLSRLLQDDFPILMEGVHCTYLLTDNRFSNRKCIVRLHNVEYLYYYSLFKNSSFSVKKLYYWLESRLLKKYEKKIAGKAHFLTVSETDRDVYQKRLDCRSVDYLPLFIPGWDVNPVKGKGPYCLYQGDLSIGANEKAVYWLLEKVFSTLSIPFIIAGKNPSAMLLDQVGKLPNATLVPNPSESEMQVLIRNAQINVMPSYTTTGIKIKLLNALFNGRHCLVNTATIHGSGLGQLCHIADTPMEFQAIITKLYTQEVSNEEILLRKKMLESIFDNKKSAAAIADLLP